MSRDLHHPLERMKRSYEGVRDALKSRIVRAGAAQRGLEINEYSFAGLRGSVSGGVQSVEDFLLTRKGMDWMATLQADIEEGEDGWIISRRATQTEMQAALRYRVYKVCKEWIDDGPLADVFTKDWLPVLKALLYVDRQKQFYFGMYSEYGKTLVTIIETLKKEHKLTPALVIQYIDVLKENDRLFIMGPGEKWAHVLTEVIEAQCRNGHTPSPRLLRENMRYVVEALKTEKHSNERSDLLSLRTQLRGFCVPESSTCVKDVLAIAARNRAEVQRLTGRDWMFKDEILLPLVTSEWSRKNFSGDITQIPVEIREKLYAELQSSSLSERGRAIFQKLCMITRSVIDSQSLLHPFDLTRLGEIVEQAQRIYEHARSVPDQYIVQALKVVGQHLPLDQVDAAEVIGRVLGNSAQKWRAVGALSTLSFPVSSLVSYAVHSREALLYQVGKTALIASQCGINVPKYVERFCIPLRSMSEEDQIKWLTGGPSKAERAFAFLLDEQYRHGDDRKKKRRDERLEKFRSKVRRFQNPSSDAQRTSALGEIDSELNNLGLNAFSHFVSRKVTADLRGKVGVAVTEAQLQDETFLHAVSLTLRAQANGDVRIAAKELLARLANDEHEYDYGRKENAEWLDAHLNDDAKRVWCGEIKSVMPVVLEELTASKVTRVETFMKIVSGLVTSVPYELHVPRDEALTRESFMKWFITVPAEKYGSTFWYKDLKAQYDGLLTLGERKRTVIPESIVVEKEQDPSRALMMGTLVNGSCLDAAGQNYWSTFVNATEANKGVFWIKDENGKILSRFLLAIGNDKKIVTFPIYDADSGLNFESYQALFVTELAKKMGLGVNGDVGAVQNLISTEWYKDPVVTIAEEKKQSETNGN
jgi:hypothetical protein